MLRIIIGDRWGKLAAIGGGKPRGTKQLRRHILCRCDCGVELEIPLTLLRNGSRTSCGCTRRLRVTPAVPPVAQSAPEIVPEIVPWWPKPKPVPIQADWADVELCKRSMEGYIPEGAYAHLLSKG